MPPLRATYDQNVIDAWSAAVAATRVSSADIALRAGVAMVAGGAIGLLAHSWLVGLVIVGFAVVAWVAVGASFATAALECPHCRQRPWRMFQRASLPIDHCPHCYYWLVVPYGNRSVGPGIDARMRPDFHSRNLPR